MSDTKPPAAAEQKPADPKAPPQPRPAPINARVQFGSGVLFASMAEVWATAKAFVDNGVAPKNGTAASVAAAMVKGQALGMDPITAMSTITVINGRAKAEVVLRLALVRRSGALGDWRVSYTGTDGDDAYTCHVFASRRDTGEAAERTFSILDAKRAGLWGKEGPWQTYGAKRMLYNRAAGFLLDDLFSDVVLGFDHDTPDEPAAQLPAGIQPLAFPSAAPAPAALPAPAEPDPLFSDMGGKATAPELVPAPASTLTDPAAQSSTAAPTSTAEPQKTGDLPLFT